jgi:hypothetical protein
MNERQLLVIEVVEEAKLETQPSERIFPETSVELVG